MHYHKTGHFSLGNTQALIQGTFPDTTMKAVFTEATKTGIPVYFNADGQGINQNIIEKEAR